MNVNSLSKVLSNPEIKSFLNCYPSSERSEVLKITLLHTIYSLKGSFSSTPSLPQLKDLISNAGKIQSLEGTISLMKSKLNHIKKEILSLEGSLSSPPAQLPPVQHPNDSKDLNHTQKITRSRSAPHITKAPSNWRQGDTTVFRDKFVENHPGNTRNLLFRETSPQNLRGHNYKEFLRADDTSSRPKTDAGIYPEWWKALTELDVKPTRVTAKVTQHVPPKPSLKPERKEWVEPNKWYKDIAEEAPPPMPRKTSGNQVKFSPRTSDKSAEANFESIDSSKGENGKVTFSDKKYAGWVGDFSKVVKSGTGKIEQNASKEISYTDSSRKDHSSGYTSSSMTNYVPNSEMKHFYQGEFNRFLQSRAGESSKQEKIKSPYQYSLSSEEQDFHYE